METVKKCYDFLMSPQPVADFQKFCYIRPKYKYELTEDGASIGKEESQCKGNCYCDKNSTTCSNSGKECQNPGQVSNGHVNSAIIDKSGLKKRNNGTVNGYNNGFVHDINQNGTNIPHNDKALQPGKASLKASGPEYEIGNYFIFALFRFGAELGNEFFYVIFYTFSMWNFDTLVCLKLVLVWVLLMYVGQSLKDVICWPRPASPPVFQLEDRYALEYGMPSTHAMVGTAIPFMLLIFTVDRYEYPVFLGLVIAISWCTLVCLSRLYLGMHTIMDILAGLVLVTILLFIMVPWAETAVLFIVTNRYGGLLALLGGVVLTICYPTLDRWSTARGDTTVFLGVASGMLLGTWINYQLGYIIPSNATLPYQIAIMEFEWLTKGSLRMLTGVIATVTMRFFMKLLTFNLLCYLLNKDPKDPKTKTCLKIEIPHKFCTYFGLAVCASVIAPIIFTYFDINRETYYSELF